MLSRYLFLTRKIILTVILHLLLCQPLCWRVVWFLFSIAWYIYALRKKVKVKWPRYRPRVAQSVGRVIALLFHDRGTRREWVVRSTPRPHFIHGKDPVPILQGTGWAPGPVWTDGKSSPLRDFRSRTVQPVISHYTDWATRPTFTLYILSHNQHRPQA